MESLQPPVIFDYLLNLFQKASQGNDTVFYTLLGAAFLCGAMYAFLGYRVYNYVFALGGMVVGAVAGYLFVEALPIDAGQPERLKLAVAVIFGFVGLIIAPKLLRLCSFLLGGFAISLMIHPLVPLIQKPYGWVVLVVAFAAGGGMALLLIRATMILATSIAGSYLLSFCAFALVLQAGFLSAPFNFLLFYVVWIVLAFLALTSQLKQKTPASMLS
jgi:hypothetical protein